MQNQVVLAGAHNGTTAAGTGVSGGRVINIRRSAHLMAKLAVVRVWKQSLTVMALVVTTCCLGQMQLWARCTEPCGPPGAISALLDTRYGATTPEIFWEGGDGRVWVTYPNGTSWKTVDVSINAAPAPAFVAPGSALVTLLDPGSNAPEVFYIGNDQHVHVLYLNGPIASGSWTSDDVTMKAVGAPPAQGLALTALFDAINGTPDVFYLGADQHVHILFLDGPISSGNWFPYDVTMRAAGAPPAALGTGLSSVFTATPVPPYGPVNVFYIATNGDAYNLSFSDAKQWQGPDWTLLGNAPQPSGSALNSPIHPDAIVDYFTADQHLRSVDGSIGSAVDLTSQSGAPPADSGSPMTTVTGPILPTPGQVPQVYQFYVASQHVFALYQPLFSPWIVVDLNVKTGAPSMHSNISTLTGLYNHNTGQVSVFYWGTDLYIYQLSGSVDTDGNVTWNPNSTRL